MTKYLANPIIVDAFKIIGIGQLTNKGEQHLLLDDGTDGGKEYVAKPELLSRIAVKVGDYLVTQEDGYIYLNPKDVFERKYAPLVESEALCKSEPQPIHAAEILNQGTTINYIPAEEQNQINQ